MKTIFFNLIKFSYFLVYFGLLILCLFFQNIDYATKINAVKYNIFLLPLGILIIISLFFISKKIAIKFDFNKFLKSSSIFFFVYSLFFISMIYFHNSYDAGYIQTTAKTIVENKGLYDADYFSYYPNNMYLLCLEVAILKFLKFFGLYRYVEVFYIIINCLLITYVSIVLVAVLKCFDLEKVYIVFSYLLYWLFVGVLPWGMMFYSGVFALAFNITIFYLFLKLLKNQGNNFILLFILGILTHISYKIKPHIAILLLAIIIYIFIFRLSIIKLKSLAVYFSSLLISVLVFNFLISMTPINIDKDKSFTYTHYFMMGLNNEAKGVYSRDDFELSSSAKNVSDREKINIEVAKKRLKDYGFLGVLNHIKRKNLATYNDGTFTWKDDVEFKITPYSSKVLPRVSKFYQNLYYANGSNYKFFEFFVHSVWFGILFLGIFSTFMIKKSKNKELLIIYLSLMGMTLFLTLFECRGRYLYQFLPFFIILATFGLSFFVKRLKNI